MAISTPTLLFSAFSTVNNSIATVPSVGQVTLTNGALYIFAHAFDRSTAPSNSTASFRENGTDTTSTWTLIQQSESYDGNTNRMTAWYKQATATSALTLAFDPPGGANSCNQYLLAEIASGYKTTAPISQSVSSVATAVTSVTLVLPSAPGGDSLTFLVAANTDASTAIDARSGWVELSEDIGTGTGSDSGAIESQYKEAGGEQTGSASVSVTNRDWAAILFEIAAAAGGAVGPGNYYQYYLRHVVGDAA